MHLISQEIRKELMDKSDHIKPGIGAMITEKTSDVSRWEYASDEYFTFLPYYHEIYKFKKGRILKGIAESERFTKRMIHSFGFDKSDQLIIMQYPQKNRGATSSSTVIRESLTGS